MLGRRRAGWQTAGVPAPIRITERHRERVQALFPAACQVALADRLPEDFALLADETSATARMAPRRLQSFMQGRACARAALAALGVAAQAVPVGPQRAPVWPAGIIGSIAHSDAVAAAVVARRGTLESLGIDIEQAGGMEAGTQRLVCTPDELGRLPDDGGTTARLLFSIKEAVYKCLWPGLARYVDFQEVRVHLGPDAESGQYVAEAAGPDLDGALFARLHGYYAQFDGLIVSSAWLRAGTLPGLS